MRALLDTCTFLWWASDSGDLSDRVADIIADPSNHLFLSCVSAWEITVKHSSGRLKLPDLPENFVPARRTAAGILSLSLDEETVMHEQWLPRLHNDPFDRMLICQAIVHGLAIVTPDPQIARYSVSVVW